MSDAYSSMIRAGIGWVEVSREFDPLKYPFRVREVHRNDIYWDWTSTGAGLVRCTLPPPG